MMAHYTKSVGPNPGFGIFRTTKIYVFKQKYNLFVVFHYESGISTIRHRRMGRWVSYFYGLTPVTGQDFITFTDLIILV